MKVAIVYDRVNKWGGAERVLLILNKMFPDAPLYTSVYDEKLAPWAKVFPKVYTSFLQKIPFAKNNHEFLAIFMPIAFELFNFDKYDLVISVSSEAAKGIITKPETLHVSYCLTPTRYLWNNYDFYFRNNFLKFISTPFVNYLRKWDRMASSRSDKIISISSEVKKRVRKFYSRESEIIWPPSKNFYDNNSLGSKKDYYLIVNRTIPYKRNDIAIKAFNHLNKPLYIVGTGSELKKLKSMAKGNVKFYGHISDDNLVNLYKNAKALIMPQEEDYGLVSVEAQSLGTPVIAYKKGGVIDTVRDGITGLFFNRQNIQSLTSAIEKFEKMSFNKESLVTNAKKFSEEVFERELQRSLVRFIGSRRRGD